MTDDEIITVVQAHKEGKRIEARECYRERGHNEGWKLVEPNWDFYRVDFRVAPEARKPREWSVCVTPDNHIIASIHHKEQCRESIIVREVME